MDCFLVKKNRSKASGKRTCGQEQGHTDVPGMLTVEAMAKLEDASLGI